MQCGKLKINATVQFDDENVTIQTKAIENCFLVLFILLMSFPMKMLTLSLPESVKETSKVVLTFESVDEILWCDHSNETLPAVLSHGTIWNSS